MTFYVFFEWLHTFSRTLLLTYFFPSYWCLSTVCLSVCVSTWVVCSV